MGILVLVLSAPVGCSAYRPIDPVAVPQGTAVRATLAEPVDLPLEHLTVRAARRVDGEMIRFAGDELLVSAGWVLGAGGGEYPARGETVAIPVDRLANLERKGLSWWRTGGALVGVVAGGLLVERILSGSGGPGGGGGGGPPQPR